MKNALLWQRILNEGIKYDPITLKDRKGLAERVVSAKAASMWAELGQQIVYDVIKAPIIVTVPFDGSYAALAPDLSRYGELVFPFPEFWIEGEITQGNELYVNHWGALVVASASQIEYTVFVSSHTGGFAWAGIAEMQLDNYHIQLTEDDGRNACMNMVISYSYARSIGHDRCALLVSWFIIPICDALLLMSCSNIGLKANSIDAKQAKRAARRVGGSPEDYRYHTLTIRPAGSKPNAPSQDLGIMPSHTCRQHVAHYGLAEIHGHPDGQDRGFLFGKYSGRYLIPPHVKGDKKNGVVEKDYQLDSTLGAK